MESKCVEISSYYTIKKKILINYFYLDEETSYILYWKYVLLCKSICQQADYKSDIKYYEGNCFISKQVDYKESKEGGNPRTPWASTMQTRASQSC